MKSLLLWDNHLALGKIAVESDDGELVLGDFEQFAPYQKYISIFEEYQEAANEQLLVEIDRLDKTIAAIGFRVTDLDGSDPSAIRDVQIGSSGISFRWR